LQEQQQQVLPAADAALLGALLRPFLAVQLAVVCLMELLV
jgi:hypothetical protein